MTLLDRLKGDNLAAQMLDPILGECFVADLDGLGENARGHDALELIAADPLSDEEHPVDELNLGRLLDVKRGLNSVGHTLHSLPPKTWEYGNCAVSDVNNPLVSAGPDSTPPTALPWAVTGAICVSGCARSFAGDA